MKVMEHLIHFFNIYRAVTTACMRMRKMDHEVIDYWL